MNEHLKAGVRSFSVGSMDRTLYRAGRYLGLALLGRDREEAAGLGGAQS